MHGARRLWRLCGSLDLRPKVVIDCTTPEPSFHPSLLLHTLPRWHLCLEPPVGQSSVALKGRRAVWLLPSAWSCNDLEPCTNWPASPWAVPETIIGTDSNSLPHQEGVLQEYILEEEIIFPRSFSERASGTSHFAFQDSYYFHLRGRGMKHISKCLCHFHVLS